MGREVTVRGVRITARTKADGALNNPPGDITIETARTITGDGMENDADWTYGERFTGTSPDGAFMSIRSTTRSIWAKSSGPATSVSRFTCRGTADRA